MNGAYQLIKSIVPNPVFSETFSELAVPDLTNSFLQVFHDFRDRGARCIIVHSIVVSIATFATVSNVCIVKDNFNKILMKFFTDGSMSGLYSFKHVIGASSIKLTFNVPSFEDVSLFFTVQYQYVYDAESKVLKP